MEEIAQRITVYISHAAEITASFIIGLAVLKLMGNYALAVYPSKRSLQKENLRLEFGTAVSVALELLLGADVLATAIAPSWNDIGQLAAIATIRTMLNYFLEKELKKE